MRGSVCQRGGGRSVNAAEVGLKRMLGGGHLLRLKPVLPLLKRSRGQGLLRNPPSSATRLRSDSSGQPFVPLRPPSRRHRRGLLPAREVQLVRLAVALADDGAEYLAARTEAQRSKEEGREITWDRGDSMALRGEKERAARRRVERATLLAHIPCIRRASRKEVEGMLLDDSPQRFRAPPLPSTSCPRCDHE